MDADQRLLELGIHLPTPPRPAANYLTAVRTGNLLFLAGHGPVRPDGRFVTGRLGEDMTVEQGYEVARLVGLNLLATARAESGSLARVSRVVKVLGMVRCTPDFGQHPQVINGCSDLFVELWGEAGRHARSAVGMSGLPFGIAVEIEAVFELAD